MKKFNEFNKVNENVSMELNRDNIDQFRNNPPKGNSNTIIGGVVKYRLS